MSHSANTVEIGADDLPLHCPPSGAAQWSQHPRVFLELDAHGAAKCPYCGTVYQLKAGVVLKGHH